MKRKYRKVGIRRGLGGWGDVQMGLAVAELYAEEKGGPVTFGCLPELLPLGDNVPAVEVLPLEQFEKLSFGRKWDITDPCIKYEHALQPNVDRNRPEIWATKLGLKGSPQLRVYLTDKERQWANRWTKQMRLDGRFLLGIVPKSYSWGRDWEEWVKVLYLLRQETDDIVPLVFLAGLQTWEAVEYAVLGVPIIRFGIRENLALMSECQLVAGVDTGPMHSAVGLGRPTLWVFTHIDGSIRTKGYEGAEVIQRSDLPCCPCWYESMCHDPRFFMRCKEIPPAEVAERIQDHYRRWLCSMSNTVRAFGKPRQIWEIGTAFHRMSP